MSGIARRQANALYELKTITDSGQVLTVDATAGGVQLAAAAVPAGTKIVKLNIQDADVRMTTDGGTPTPGSNIGDVIYAGEFVYLSVTQALAAKFLRESGTSAIIYSEALKY